MEAASTVVEVWRSAVVLVCRSLLYYHCAYWDSRSASSWRPTRSAPLTTPSAASMRSFPSNPPTPPSTLPPPPPPVVVDRQFLVARTWDVIGAVEEVKEKGKGEALCIEGVSVVDVRNGRIEIVTVSGDQSTLAAAVGRELCFDPAAALLDKGLDNQMEACKDQFKEFERQDVKHQEDLKHSNQKIKKVEDKLEKDSSKIDEIEKDNEESSTLIPKLEEEIPKLQQLFHEGEKVQTRRRSIGLNLGKSI